MSGHALIVGVTGISGGNLAERVLADGWQVSGLCRDPSGLDARIAPLAANLEDGDAVAGGRVLHRHEGPAPRFYVRFCRNRCATPTVRRAIGAGSVRERKLRRIR